METSNSKSKKIIILVISIALISFAFSYSKKQKPNEINVDKTEHTINNIKTEEYSSTNNQSSKNEAIKSEYKDLSLKFDYKLTVDYNNDEDNKIKEIQIEIINKSNKTLEQTIAIVLDENNFLFDDVFRNNSVRSYITGFNKELEILDGDYGDFIVADFNFDGNEDFAIKINSGGNGGPFYKFFTYRKKGLFSEEKFLTEELQHFPSEIDSENKTLTTYTPAGVSGYNENIYIYNIKSDQWKMISSTFIKYSQE